MNNLLAVLRRTMPRLKEGSRITSRLGGKNMYVELSLPFLSGRIPYFEREKTEDFLFAYVKFDFAKVTARDINLGHLDTQKTF